MPFLLVWAIFALSPVTISVVPAFSAAHPAQFNARATIERHADNRLLELAFDGPEYKFTAFQIDGAQPQRVFAPVRVEFTAPGEYLATATLTRIEGGRAHHYVASQPFRVLGLEP